MERVKSSDVLDASHVVLRTFRGVVLGYFRRMGPNAWDDYQFVRVGARAKPGTADRTSSLPGDDALDTLEVSPRVPVQLEANGVEVRMRSQGRVVRLRWLPEDEDLAGLDALNEPRRVRQRFIERYLSPLDAEGGIGAAAVIVKKLGES